MNIEENKEQINGFIDKASLALIGLLLVFFPLVFTSQTTDIFVLSKQALLAGVSLAVLLLFGLKSLLNNKVVIRKNPFDLPVFLFTIAVLLSGVFAVNKADSFISFVPLLFAVFAYFIIVNTAKTKNAVLFLFSVQQYKTTICSTIYQSDIVHPLNNQVLSSYNPS